MKINFLIFSSLIVNFSASAMTVAEFEEQLDLPKIALYNKTYSESSDFSVSDSKDEASLLLQYINENNISEKNINHLAGALTAIKKICGFIKFSQINEQWPATIIRLSITDPNERNEAYCDILDIIKKYNGCTISYNNLIESVKELCVTLAFPKTVPIFEPLQDLKKNSFLTKNAKMLVYPDQKNLSFRLIKKDKKGGIYYFRYNRTFREFSFERNAVIEYNYHRENTVTTIEYEDQNDMSSLPDEQRKEFAHWPLSGRIIKNSPKKDHQKVVLTYPDEKKKKFN